MVAGAGPGEGGDQGSKKMPYSKDNPPDVCKGMPSHAVAIWVAAFNSAVKDNDESAAMAIAMSAVKRIYEQDAQGHWSPKASNAGEEPDETTADLAADTSKLHDTQAARASKYGIAAKDGGALTPPADYPTGDAEYGDPVNYRYPLDESHVKPAVSYFNQAGQQQDGGYNQAEWAIIGKRIAQASSRLTGTKHVYKAGKIETLPGDANATEPPMLLLLLAEVSGASPVEFLRTGTFTDMHGSEVVVTEADLDTFVANFESGTAGQDVPVDVDHKRGEAYGWVRRVYRNGMRLLAQVEWNELGRKLVGEKVYRYLSASIDQERKTLRSISLVNFPAVKGLKPVELAEHYFVPKLEQEAIVAGLAQAGQREPGIDVQAAAVAPPASGIGENKHGRVVTMAEQEQVVTIVPPATGDVDLADFRKKIETEMRDALLDEYKRLESQRGQMFSELMEQVRDERAVADFSTRVTGEGAHALPVKADELAGMLKALPRAQREQWTTLLKAVADNGTVDFTERGTSKGGTPQKLDPEVGKALGRWLKAKVGNTADEFLQANELGSAKQYDLSEWGV
jgi:cation transport regulator ChaB